VLPAKKNSSSSSSSTNNNNNNNNKVPRPPPALQQWPPFLQSALDSGRLCGEKTRFLRDDSQGDCYAFVEGLRRRLVDRYGCDWRQGTTAKTVLLEQHTAQQHQSRPSTTCIGVIDQDGRKHLADAVVVCAGAKSRSLLLTADVSVPMYPLRGYSITLPKIGGGGGLVKAGESKQQQQQNPFIHVLPYHIYITEMPRGRVRVSGFGEFGGLDLREKEGGLGSLDVGRSTEMHDRLEATLRKIVPNVDELVDFGAAERWVGERPLTPDLRPVVGATKVPGLYVNAGHSFNGWRDATYTSHLVASCVESQSNHPLREKNVELLYSIERFKLFRPFLSTRQPREQQQ